MLHSQDFYGDEYQSHNSCMSEDQRYSKEGRGGWDPSKGQVGGHDDNDDDNNDTDDDDRKYYNSRVIQGHKGEKKQNAWVNNLRSILAEASDLDSDVRTIVNTIMDHENIPRKKPKFVNFVKNIMRNRARPHSIDKTWDLFSEALKSPATEAEVKMEVTAPTSDEVVETKVKEKKKKKKNKDVESSEESSENTKKIAEKVPEESSEKENVGAKPKKKKKDKKLAEQESEGTLKRKRDEDMEVEEEEEASASKKKKKFDWDETITNVLLKKEGNEMKLNKLKKKCVNEFLSQNEGTHKTTEEVGAKFDKKLKKRKYRVLKDKVKLILDDEGKEEKEKEKEVEACEMKTVTVTEKCVAPKTSFNNWESANLGSSAQNDKFRRLMGLGKSSNTTKETIGKSGFQARNDQKIFRDLEEGFERARQTHFGGRCFST